MKKRQGLLKAILVLAVAISVFFANTLVVYASEDQGDGDDGIAAYASDGSGMVAIEPSSWVVAGYSPYLYLEVSESQQVDSSVSVGTLQGSSVFRVSISFPSGLKGYIYGSFWVAGTFSFNYGSITSNSTYGQLRLTSETVEIADGVYASVYMSSDDYANSSFSFVVRVDFNGYDLYSSSTVNGILDYTVEQSVTAYNGYLIGSMRYPLTRSSLASDYAGQLYYLPFSGGSVESRLDNINDTLHSDLTTSISNASEIGANQMAQQESIAQAQSEQSASQHNEALHGYDTSQAESNQTDFDNALSNYESQEDAILSDAMDSVDSVDMDTSFISSLASTFSLIRVVFMAIVTALGDFGILITITLTFALALFAIGWFRGG